jgi:hypothetical protein
LRVVRSTCELAYKFIIFAHLLKGANNLVAPSPRLDHDAMRRNCVMILSFCLSVIFSENRFPLFRIML